MATFAAAVEAEHATELRTMSPLNTTVQYWTDDAVKFAVTRVLLQARKGGVASLADSTITVTVDNMVATATLTVSTSAATATKEN